ncbi:hypothetical protein NQ318_016127 [Aromia moschata]|uniref:Mos1 transposase HTH domain-containing protein n=1 Tax=Aromia moschata TaxID=1265417 RepID=A0AAV8Y0J1_9CUCU|nr:hypothetical protein NQ318_016127 [Aromia moschata]
MPICAVKNCVYHKSANYLRETYALLKEVHGNECLSCTQVFEWFKWFKEGRETTEDDPSLGRPSKSKADENIEKTLKRLGLSKWIEKRHVTFNRYIGILYLSETAKTTCGHKRQKASLVIRPEVEWSFTIPCV